MSLECTWQLSWLSTVESRYYSLCHEAQREAHRMRRPVTALVLALVSLILCPGLLFSEMIALIFSATVINEPANTVPVKVLTMVVVVAIAGVTVALPALTLRMGIRARSAAISTQSGGADVALAAVVIASVVTAGAIAGQIYLILMGSGICSLDSCEF